jgi:hypothetical protein
MSTITVLRSGVTAEEVSVVLRRELGSRYTVTPSARHWQANLTASPCNNAQQTREGEDAGNSQADA